MVNNQYDSNRKYGIIMWYYVNVYIYIFTLLHAEISETTKFEVSNPWQRNSMFINTLFFHLLPA